MSDALDPPPQRINGLAACGEVLLVGEANPYGADPRYALHYDPERSEEIYEPIPCRGMLGFWEVPASPVVRVALDHDRATILIGDSADLGSVLRPCTIDAIVCDPPSGIAFMGKTWDTDKGGRDAWIEWLARTIAPAFAALKPGGHGLFWALPRTSHWTAMALELAGFEIRDRVTHLFGCLTADVDVLTPTGWKRGIDVAVGEQVAQWDPATGAISLAPVERVYRAPWSGDLVRFKNADTDQALTPNHRVVHRSGLWKRWSEYRVAEADQVSRRSPCRLPLAGLHDGPGIGGEDYAALLGWVWTEGGFDKTGAGVRVYQSSVNAPKVDEIDALLDRLGAHSRYSYDRTYESRHRGAIEYQAVTWYFSGDLAERVRRDLPGKHPTFDLLWRMSLAEKRAFLRAALLGDGSMTKPILDKRTGKIRRGGAWSLEQKHAGDRAWFVTLLALVGWRGHDYARKTRDGGSVSVTQHADTTISPACLRDDREHYVGEVWCVGVPTGAFVARRKGRVFITGNSGFPKSLNVSKAIDAHLGAERPVVGHVDEPCGVFAHSGSGVPQDVAKYAPRDVTAGSAEAAAWDGWGTALKPAAEDWWLVRKPLGGTVAATVLAHGTGALNIDASRIGSAGGGTSCSNRDEAGKCLGHANAGQSTSGETFHGPNTSGGRWPAHVVFSHDDACELVGRETEVVDKFENAGEARETGVAYGETGRQVATSTAALEREVYRCAPGCPVALLDAQSGERTGAHGRKGGKATRIGYKEPGDPDWTTTDIAASKGGASRFFYCAKPSKAETEAGLDHLPIRTGGEMTDREDGSAGLSSPRAGAGRGGGRRNHHPCLPPGEVVRAIDGWRAIETVRVGDQVMAHDGTWRRVVEAFAKPCDDETVTIAVDGENRTSTLTTNHPMLIWRPVKNRNSIVGAEIDWQDAGDVRVGDYTMTPVMKSGASSDHNAGWWWSLGLWLAKGSTLSNGKNDHRYPQLALRQNETDLVARLRATFGAERVRAYPSTTTLGQTAVIFVPGLVDEWVAWCGHGAREKRVPEQVWAQDDQRRRALLDGYLAGDGCVQRGAPRAKSASEDLAAGICTLAEACGYRATSYRWDSETGRTTIQGRDVADNGHVAMYLGTVEHLRRPNLVEHEGVRYTLRRVKAVSRRPYCGPVYNLTVEGAHTFQVRVGMSHNTKKSVALMRYLITLITPPGGIVLDPFAGSGTTGVAAIAAGFRFVGCEQGGTDEEYVPILLGRIEHALRVAEADKPAGDAPAE